MKIDIPEVLLDLRERVVAGGSTQRDEDTDHKVRRESPAFRRWSAVMNSPARYRLAGHLLRTLATVTSRTTVLDRFIPPLAAWRSTRSVPRPEGGSFRARWRRRGDRVR